MKKVLLFLAAAAMLAVSCTNEPEGSLIGKAKVTYTVDGPSQIATKAMGTIGSEYTLYYEVRLWDGSALGAKLTGEGLSGSKTVASDQWPTTVTFDLARGKQYKILFWAQSKTAPAGLYNADNLAAVAIDYTKMEANNEECDAFSGSDVITPTGAMAASATLTRPFALVNLGTSDATQFKTASGGCTVGDVKVTVTGTLASSFNVATGEAGTGAATSFAPNAAPIDAFDAKTLIVNETAFNYLSAVYVLPAAGSEVIEVAYIIKDNNNADITTLEVTNVPVKTNYRTNITGKLLTGTTTYNISVDQAFTGNTNKVVGPTFASVAALNTYFGTMADNSDNGDIEPEVVTLTTIADSDAIVLPAISGSVVIRIPAVLETGTLSIGYAASGDKPANVSLYVTKLQNLTANITSSHFTLLDGSWITGTANVSTSGTTFVVEQGARIGTAQIAQGNASIAGTVTTVSVPNGATADGTNAVQVFLEKVSAVDKIELNAKTDVVVEQPKDQIEVVATERKVAVYVNDGAANSTATAQNGGVIYVEANVPCTVTADGTSTAEEGNVSSTVIINENATGSAVVATNGASVDLKANANCDVTSTGTSEGTSTPSTVNIDEVKTGAEVNAVISQGGEVNVSTGVAPGVVDIKEGVALIGDVVYTSLAEAVAAVPDETPTTIVMIGDDAVENGITIAAEKNIVLELAGHTVSGNTNSANTYALITNRGTLTIQDNTDTNKDGTGTGLLTTYITNADQQDVPGYASNTITNNGTLTVKSGKLVNNGNGYACYAIDNQTNGTLYNPTLKIEGGCMEQMREYTYAVRMFCNSETNTNSVEITGGVITGGYSLWLQTPSENKAPNASLTISGGKFISRDGGSFIGYYKNASRENITVNISGGTFTGNPNGLVIQGLDDGVAGYKELNISGGVFNGFAAGGNLGGFITGGTFGTDPTDYLKNGYEAIDNGDGTWTVKIGGVAAIGDVIYKTLAEAVSAAQADEIIKMVDNTAVSSSITLQRNLTLDLNGKTITSSAILFNIYANCNLTITDSGENGAIDVTNSKIVYSSGGGTVTLAGGALSVHSSSTFTYGIHVGSGSNFVMTGGSITIPATSTSTYNYCVSNSGNGTTTISGGELIAEASGGNYAVQISGGGTTNISGGSVIARAYPAGFKSPYALYNTGGTLNVSGGYFKAWGDKDTYSAGYLVDGTASISGGYFGGNYYYSLGNDQIASGYAVRTLTSSEPDETDAAAYSSGYKYKVDAQ